MDSVNSGKADWAVIIAGVTAFAMFIPSLWLSQQFADRCTPDSTVADWCILLWIAATPFTSTICCFAFGLRGKQLLRSLSIAALPAMLTAIGLPNLDFGSADRSRQRRTIADMRYIATIFEEYRASHGEYPPDSSLPAVRALGKHALPTTDAWGNGFVVATEPKSYRIVSYGLCGCRNYTQLSGELETPEGDLVMENGVFLTLPAGMTQPPRINPPSR